MNGHRARQDVRAKASTLSARYRSPTTFEYVEEACSDISLGGMFIASKHPAPAGTLLKLECEGEQHVVHGVARVVWLRHADGPEGPSGMGVKFVRLEAGARDAIQSWVDAEANDTADEASETSAAEPLRAEAHGEGASSPGPGQHEHQRDDREITDAGARPEVITAPPLEPSRALPSAQQDDPRSQATRSRTKDLALIGACLLVVLVFAGLLQTEWFDRVGSDDSFEQAKPAQTETFGKALHPALGSLHTNAREGGEASKPFTTSLPANARVNSEGSTPLAAPAPVPASTQTSAPPSPEPTRAQVAQTVQVADDERGPRVIEIITKPKGATVSVEGQTIIAPGRVTLDAMPERVRVTSVLEGHVSTSSWVDRSGFVVEYGRRVRRVFHTLKPEPSPQADAKPDAKPDATLDAKLDAEPDAKSEASPEISPPPGAVSP